MYRWTFLFFLFSFNLVEASVSAPSCLTIAHSNLDPQLNLKAKNVSTVVTKPITLANGKKAFALEKTGEMWRSGYSPDMKNIQGDPRNFIFIFGADTAKKFTFEMLSDTRMLAPRAALFQESIVEANVFLESRKMELIPVSFRDSVKSDPISSVEYLVGVERLRFPVADGGHFFVHDIIHYGSILHPRVILEHLANKSIYLREFLRQIQQAVQSEKPEVKQLMEDLSLRILNLYADYVDACHGNITLVTVERLYDTKTQSEIHKDHAKNVLAFVSEKSLSIIIEKFWQTQLSIDLARLATPDNNGKVHLTVDEYNRIFDRMEKLSQNYVQNLPKEMKEGLQYSPEELIQFVDARINALKEWGSIPR